jgi:hypothetical protein
VVYKANLVYRANLVLQVTQVRLVQVVYKVSLEYKVIRELLAVLAQLVPKAILDLEDYKVTKVLVLHCWVQ